MQKLCRSSLSRKSHRRSLSKIASKIVVVDDRCRRSLSKIVVESRCRKARRTPTEMHSSGLHMRFVRLPKRCFFIYHACRFYYKHTKIQELSRLQPLRDQVEQVVDNKVDPVAHKDLLNKFRPRFTPSQVGRFTVYAFRKFNGASASLQLF